MSDLIDNKKIQEKFKQLRPLTQYRKMEKSKLWEIASRKVLEADKDLEVSSLFSDASEIKTAKKLLGKYLEDYSPSSVSDKNNLRHLIYLEIIQVRLHNKLNKLSGSDSAVPLNMIDSVHKNLREISEMKTKLGLVGLERGESRSDVYKAWELLKEKFKRWREENQGSRSIICPYDGKMIMLKIRTEAWEAQKHPFFKDRILGNKHLIKMYREGKITKEDVAETLECSTDYVGWLIDKWGLDKKEELKRVTTPTKEGNAEQSEASAESGPLPKEEETKESGEE